MLWFCLPGEVAAPSCSSCLHDHFSQMRCGGSLGTPPLEIPILHFPNTSGCALYSVFRLCADVTQTKNRPQPDAAGAQDPSLCSPSSCFPQGFLCDFPAEARPEWQGSLEVSLMPLSDICSAREPQIRGSDSPSKAGWAQQGTCRAWGVLLD